MSMKGIKQQTDGGRDAQSRSDGNNPTVLSHCESAGGRTRSDRTELSQPSSDVLL